jgi:hypothetical protein
VSDFQYPGLLESGWKGDNPYESEAFLPILDKQQDKLPVDFLRVQYTVDAILLDTQKVVFPNLTLNLQYLPTEAYKWTALNAFLPVRN